jgi:hypothetical protein
MIPLLEVTECEASSGTMRERTIPVTPTTEDDQPADLFFDPWLTARGATLQRIVSSAVGRLEHADQYYGLRKRARRSTDQRTHSALVEAVIANLAYSAVEGLERPIAVSLSKDTKRTRYDRRPALVPCSCG